MIKPNIPDNETDRLASLHDYQILDTLPEEDLDNITKLASEICETPISLVSLVDLDRQWFKSKIGLEAQETPREFAFCAHAINYPGELFIVPDSREDLRFYDNPLVTEFPNIIFYAGIPLVDPNGLALGTLCIVDQKPRELNNHQKTALKILAKQVINIFELRKKNSEIEHAKQILETRNNDLEKFASVLSHDIKSPLSNIISFVELFNMRYQNILDDKGKEMLALIERVSFGLKDMVEGILTYYKSDPISLHQTEAIELTPFFNSLLELIKLPEKAIIHLPKNSIIHSKRSALNQIFLNLINNAIRYNNKEQPVIFIEFEELQDFYQFRVTDNGIGIDEKNYESIFNLFSTVNKTDLKGEMSSGIGLSTVKKLITNLKGEIEVNSIPNVSTTFQFKLKKSL